MIPSIDLAFPLKPYESATSYASRLARFVGAPSLFDLCWDLGMDWKSVVGGNAEQLDQLAALGGADRQLLHNWAIVSVPHLKFKIGHDVVPNKTLLRSRMRVCPQCIVADVQASGANHVYRRFDWNLLAIRTCPVHSTPLVHLPHLEYTFRNYDFVARVDACWPQISEAADKGQPQEFTAYERYLLDRIRASVAAPQAKLSLATFIKLTETLGLALLGYEGCLGDLSNNELHEAGQTGYEFTQNGDAGLVNALRILQTDPLQSNASHKLDFRALQIWLSHARSTSEVDHVRDIVRSYVFQNYPVQKGTVVFGKECPKTEVYSVNSVKMEHGISRIRLSRSLVDLGIAEYDGSAESVRLNRQIRAKDVERIMSRDDNLVGRWEASARLGSSDKAFRQLRLKGLIQQRQDAFDKRPKFDLREIDAFLAPVLAATQPAPAASELSGLVDLPSACANIGTGLVDAAHLVQSGSVSSAVQARVGCGLDRIFVDQEELRRAVLSSLTPALTKAGAAEFLRTSLRLVDYLIKNDYLACEKRGAALKGYDFPAIPQASIDEFLKRYTTVGRLAIGLKQSFMYLMHHLPKSGIEAIEVPKGTGLFYERKHVQSRAPFLRFDIPPDIDWEVV